MKNSKDVVAIKRIKSSTDKYVDDVIGLYKYHFPDSQGTNYSESEAREMMNVKFHGRRISEAENITLAAVVKEEVIGFVFCHFYQESRKAIVSYIAVKDSRQKTTYKLLTRLTKILQKTNRCDELFFETEVSESDNILVRWFSKKSSSMQRNVRLFDFQYKCPMVSMSHEAREAQFLLFCVGIKKDLPTKILKSKLLEILRFIYFDCYGDLYDVKDKLFIEYYAHLKEMYEYYEKTLPDAISTVDGKFRLKERSVEEILRAGESATVEFKPSLRWSLHQSQVDTRKEQFIMKSICAFSNGKGGKLFIGVSDDGEPLGLEGDYRSLKNKDQFQIHLRKLINSKFGLDFGLTQIKIEFPKVNGIEICEITVKKGKTPRYCETTDNNRSTSTKFYVRSGTSSEPLETEALVRYTKSRFRTVY